MDGRERIGKATLGSQDGHRKLLRRSHSSGMRLNWPAILSSTAIAVVVVAGEVVTRWDLGRPPEQRGAPLLDYGAAHPPAHGRRAKIVAYDMATARPSAVASP